MTMQTPYSPKPKIFGKGYGKHIAYNYILMKKFFILGWKLLVNMFIPDLFYECAHWEVIDLYYKMRGLRHGTNNEKRCDGCGASLLSSDDKPDQTTAPKAIVTEPEITEDNQAVGNFEHPEEQPFNRGTINHK